MLKPNTKNFNQETHGKCKTVLVVFHYSKLMRPYKLFPMEKLTRQYIYRDLFNIIKHSFFYSIININVRISSICNPCLFIFCPKTFIFKRSN